MTVLSNQYFPPFTTPARGVTGALIVSACAFGVLGALLLPALLLSLRSPLGHQDGRHLCHIWGCWACQVCGHYGLGRAAGVLGTTVAGGARVAGPAAAAAWFPLAACAASAGKLELCAPPPLLPLGSSGAVCSSTDGPEGQDYGTPSTVPLIPPPMCHSTHLQMYRCVDLSGVPVY